jgi:hypothetical protein
MPHIIWTRHKFRRLLVRAFCLWSRYSEVTSTYLWTNIRVSRAVLLGTTVWGTYGNIFSAQLVGFRNCCFCGQKNTSVGVGIWFFVIPKCTEYRETKKTEWKNHWFWVFENFRNQKNHWVRVFENKNQNHRSTSSGYFKNFKEPLGFMKEPEKTQQF